MYSIVINGAMQMNNMPTSKRSGTFSLGDGIPIRWSTSTIIMMVINTAKSLIVDRTYVTHTYTK